ncbi:MAG TPA: L-histidine N(alpha)-methyltransferase [Vitreimonas sp.]|uniref:L-histidine N(alpha)-methyltransferase n=1 Tax=Vitreimonas sp. TaxID=3069702 RepID=UPI002D55AA4B|nr:L-histidine N(alpha)-methyltransferase [Vitreimonas sp.]HYD88632.1 L-histidine N(alpha)-methyltransferase [Vitreimonas sp.]
MTSSLKLKPARRFEFIDLGPQQESFERAVLAGLAQPHKSVPCRFLYDARGSALFDHICDLPEYYLTRTETQILRDNAAAIAGWIGPDACLAELGSGSSVKTRIVLHALDRPAAYVPIDISREHLRAAALNLAAEHRELDIVAICADYSEPFDLPALGRRRIAFFPGSTIGNLDEAEALALLRAWRTRLGPGGGMIIGADLHKDAAILEAAYDDSAGVTEAFIKNILVRINAELGADIDPAAFAYAARFNDAASRVEMHLRSKRAQTLRVAGRSIALDESERIHIENSRKFTLEGLRALAADAGFRVDRVCCDADALFSVQLWSAA